MFFKGSLQIDPSQLTRIEKVKPTRAFKKMLFVLTSGLVSDKTEHETFCAVSILQQLNAAMRAAGISNIVRLAKDNVDFYLDTQGKKDDLKEAMDHFSLEVDSLEAELFQTLYLILEHEDDHFRYLIEIKVNRSHAVGTFPIDIEVNGVIRDFGVKDDLEPPDSMKKVFANQESYDSFQTWKHRYFNNFIDALEQAIKTHIRVDQVSSSAKVTLIRPSKPARELNRHSRGNIASSPVFHGYYGWDTDVFLYALLWSDMCHSHSIFLHDFHMVNELGDSLMDVGNTGFNAGLVDTMNPEAQLVAPSGADFVPYESSGLDTGASASGGFFDSWGGDSSSSGDSGGDSSSCSSCGSSCGSCS